MAACHPRGSSLVSSPNPPRPAAQHHPGTCWKCKISAPTPGPRIQEPQQWGPERGAFRGLVGTRRTPKARVRALEPACLVRPCEICLSVRFCLSAWPVLLSCIQGPPGGATATSRHPELCCSFHTHCAVDFPASLPVSSLECKPRESRDHRRMHSRPTCSRDPDGLTE